MKVREYVELLNKCDQDLEIVVQRGEVFYPIVEAETIVVVQQDDAFVLTEQINAGRDDKKTEQRVLVSIAGAIAE